jgi:hypothetical protein
VFSPGYLMRIVNYFSPSRTEVPYDSCEDSLIIQPQLLRISGAEERSVLCCFCIIVLFQFIIL